MKIKYHVYFKLHRFQTAELILPSGRNLEDVSKGFWIDKNGQWCNTSESVEWIPPSQLIRVVKRKI